MKYILGYRLLRRANQGLKEGKKFQEVITLAYVVKQKQLRVSHTPSQIIVSLKRW